MAEEATEVLRIEVSFATCSFPKKVGTAAKWTVGSPASEK
jgi:hypothetical protein